MVPLIDTHQHLIYPDQFDYLWIRDAPALNKSFTIDEYARLTKDAGIAASLFMEVDVAENDAAKEALYFIEQAESEAYSLCGVIASARPEYADFEAFLDRIDSPRLKGIRRVLHVVDDSVSQSQTFRRNLQKLGHRNLPFDLCILPPQHPVGLKLVDACPNTRFVLDHCGNPNISDPSRMEGWRATLKQFAEREHVSAKLSGIVASGPAGQVTIEIVHPYLDATLETFGPERLVWGSDWPVCTLTTSLPEWIQIFRDWLAQLSETEQAHIAHRNAQRIYQI